MTIALLLACATSTTEPEVWRMEYTSTVETLSHVTYAGNFLDFTAWDSADVEEEPSEWASATESTASEGLGYLIVRTDADGAAFATFDGNVYLGTYADGALDLSWDYWIAEHIESSHESGYAYTSDTEQGTTVRFQLELEGEAGAGTITWTEYRSDAATESDVWTLEAGSGNRVYVRTEDGSSLMNEMESVDCTDETCSVESLDETVWESGATLTRVYPEGTGDLAFVRNYSGIE